MSGEEAEEPMGITTKSLDQECAATKTTLLPLQEPRWRPDQTRVGLYCISSSIAYSRLLSGQSSIHVEPFSRFTGP